MKISWNLILVFFLLTHSHSLSSSIIINNSNNNNNNINSLIDLFISFSGNKQEEEEISLFVRSFGFVLFWGVRDDN